MRSISWEVNVSVQNEFCVKSLNLQPPDLYIMEWPFTNVHYVLVHHVAHWHITQPNGQGLDHSRVECSKNRPFLLQHALFYFIVCKKFQNFEIPYLPKLGSLRELGYIALYCCCCCCSRFFSFLLPSPPIAVCSSLPAFHDLGLLLILRRFDL